MVDNILYETHKNGLIHIDTGDSLNTTLTVGVLSGAAGGTWTGFDSSAPCKLIIDTLNPYPKYFVHPINSNFASNVSVSAWCKRNNTPEDEYEFCVTFDCELSFVSRVTIKPVNGTNMLTLYIDNLSWVFNSVIESARGTFNLWLLNFTLSSGLLGIQDIINSLIRRGWDINSIISGILGTDFIYLEAFDLYTEEELVIAKMTPALRF